MQFAIYHLVDATDLSMNIPFMSVILIGTNCERLAGVSHNYMVYPWYSYLIFQFFNGLIWHALSSGQNLQFKYNHRPSTIKNYCQICLNKWMFTHSKYRLTRIWNLSSYFDRILLVSSLTLCSSRFSSLSKPKLRRFLTSLSSNF